jgi:hypothetical protein
MLYNIGIVDHLFLNTITKIEHLFFSKQFPFCMILREKIELKFVLNF